MQMTNTDRSFYVYALKDPRTSPAKPFYIGKGTALRIYEHVHKIDSSKKGKRIEEILASGNSVIETIIVNNLTESESLRIEAELISAFGTIDSGGILTNSVMPKGLGYKNRPSIILPQGVKEKSQQALSWLKEAVYEFAKANPNGIGNADTASLLGLRSDYGGGSKDYLSYSILGLLMREGKIKRKEGSRKHIAVSD